MRAAIRALPLTAARDAAEAGRGQGEGLGYLEPRREPLRSAACRAQGLPIGGGIAESANTVGVEARLQGAGRRWAERHVTPMVALRGTVCSQRRAAAWTAMAATRRVRRSRPPAPVVAPVASAAAVAAARRRSRLPASPALPRSGPTTIVHGRPTARHPWKRFPAVPSSSAKR